MRINNTDIKIGDLVVATRIKYTNFILWYFLKEDLIIEICNNKSKLYEFRSNDPINDSLYFKFKIYKCKF